MSKKHIGFTLNLRTFAAVLSQDPTCRNELINGINDADLPATSPKLTSVLGSANLAEEDQEPVWASVFPASEQGKTAGQPGLFYRNSSHGGKGDRIQFRLKMQPPKSQAATTPGAALPVGAAGVSPEAIAAATALIMAQLGQGGAQAAPQQSVQADYDTSDDILG